MNRAQWVDAFVAYMTARGVKSAEGDLRRLAEDLHATQGHLDPVVVGQLPRQVRTPEAESGHQDGFASPG